MEEELMYKRLEETLNRFGKRLITLEARLREEDKKEYAEYKIKKLDEFSMVNTDDWLEYISIAIETYRDLIHYLLLKTQLYNY